MAMNPVPSFRDLLHQAIQFELMTRSMEGSSSSASVAFMASDTTRESSCPSSQHRLRGGRPPQQRRQGSGRGGGGGRRPFLPRCQLCRGKHYADKCPRFVQLQQQANSSYTPSNSTANLAHAFRVACNISESPPASDWYVDSGASAHMTPHDTQLDSLEPYSESNDKGNSGSGKV